MAQLVKNCLSMREMQETRVRTLGREDPLKKGMVTHSRILAYRIPWTGEPGRLQFMSLQRDAHDCVHAQARKTNKQKNTNARLYPHQLLKKLSFFSIELPLHHCQRSIDYFLYGYFGLPRWH